MTVSGIEPRFARLIAAVRARDREYFQRHPGVKWRIRPVVPGEFHPFWSDRHNSHVHVTRQGKRQAYISARPFR